jgi:hypothetical protein
MDGRAARQGRVGRQLFRKNCRHVFVEEERDHEGSQKSWAVRAAVRLPQRAAQHGKQAQHTLATHCSSARSLWQLLCSVLARESWPKPQSVLRAQGVSSQFAHTHTHRHTHPTTSHRSNSRAPLHGFNGCFFRLSLFRTAPGEVLGDPEGDRSTMVVPTSAHEDSTKPRCES